MIKYFLIASLMMGLVSAVYWFWKRRVEQDLAVGSAFDYDMLCQGQPDLIGDLSADKYAVLHHKINMPRFPAYLVATIGIFLAGTPIILAFLQAGAYYGIEWEIIPQPTKAATELYLNADGASLVRKFEPEALSYILKGWSGFYYFFGMLGFWVMIVYFMMRRYHQRTPGSVKEEILRAR